MAAVNIVNVTVLDNPAPFLTPLKFEITFECVQQLDEDLEWKIVYVGSATGPEHDQVLDDCLVGPVPVGTSRLVLEVPHPDPTRIPPTDVAGATVLMITCLYKGKQFARVGYWVSNTYTEPVPEGKLAVSEHCGGSCIPHLMATGAGESPPDACPPEKVLRHILADKPTVTKWPIQW